MGYRSWGGLSNVSESEKMSICQKAVKCQKIKHLDYGGGSQKNKLTQWGSHILTQILTSHMMVTKNPQNVLRKYFWAILMTFITDVKIDTNICEPHCIIFLQTSCIVQMFDYLTFDIFLTTWHLLTFDTYNLNHLSPHRAIFWELAEAPACRNQVIGLAVKSWLGCQLCTEPEPDLEAWTWTWD